MANPVIRIGLVGAGMFGGDVHLRTYLQLHRFGIVPWLGRLGLDCLAGDLNGVRFELTAVATRTKESAARALKQAQQREGISFATYAGEKPWLDMLGHHPDLDILAVATPDHLHTPPILAALERGVHVLTEKPMALDAIEADTIVELAEKKQRIVGVDMHKRYDPDHQRIRDMIAGKIGDLLYGRAVLEEPLYVSSQVFKDWAEKSDPFSYVGCHWTDLFIAYFGVKPVSLHAVGQKRKLRRDFGLDAFDAVQVKVQFDNGMSIDFINNWIVPEGFEGPVNQESVLVGTDGMVESDTQYRGLRFCAAETRMKTVNTHFTRDVPRENGSCAYCGYGVDSIIACLAAVARHKVLGTPVSSLRGTYPDEREARISVLIVHAARQVCQRNFEYMEQGRGAPVTAVFDEQGILICDPYQGSSRIYHRPV